MRNLRFAVPFSTLLVALVAVLSISIHSNDPVANAADEKSDDAKETPGHPIVVGFDRFYSDDKANKADGGTLLLGELNCISCHQTDSAIADALQ